jgi:tetratricopeptide (TPR) repeat protein
MARGAARTCPACNTLNKPTWEFCARCGEPLDAASAGGPRAAATAAAPAAVEDDEVEIPWRPALMIALSAAAIWGALAVRGGPAPAEAAIVMPTLPAAIPAAEPVAYTPARKALVDGRRSLVAGNVDGALEDLARAAADLPEDPGAQQAYARALWRAGRKEEALARFRAAAQLAPEDVGYRIEMARALDGLGQGAAAQQELEMALSGHAGDPRILEDLGQMYVKAGAPERALPLLRQALDSRPDDLRLKAQLGVALSSTGANGEAVAVLRSAVDQDPGFVMTRTLLADALYKDGRKDEAFDILRAGLETSDEAPLHKTLGSLLERSGRIQDAAQAYREYARTAPGASDAQKVLERAAALEKRAGVSTQPSS